MNKLKKVSIIFLVIFCFFVSCVYASTATVNVSAARLRKEANTNSNVITKIYKNEKIEILEKEDDWYKVKYKDKTGYLKKDLVKEDVSTENNTNESTYDSSNQLADVASSKIIIKNNTNVRFAPNMMSNSIIQIEAGTELTKREELGNWIQVTDGIFTGWVLKIKTNIEYNKQQVDSSNFETPKQNNTVTNKVNETDTTKKTNNISNKVSDTNTVKNTNNTVSNKINTDQNTSSTSNKVNETNTEKDTNKETNTNANTNTATAVSKKGKVNVETAKVREKANSTAKVIGFLDYNDVVEITAEDGDWYKFTEKDISGYVHKTLVTITESENVSSRGTTEERKQNVTASNQDNTAVDLTTKEKNNQNLENPAITNEKSVVEYAKQFLGYPYVVGGKNPTNGFDCSGFTRYVFLNFGYSLGATAANQNNIGTEITRENLEPGDLILFYDEGKTKIGHTGIYISNGDFIHAANPARGVVIDNLNTNSYYNTRFITARRIVE